MPGTGTSQSADVGPAEASERRIRRPRPRPTGPLRYFDEFFEGASDIIIVNDAEGWIIAANRAARELSGYTAEDVERGLHLGEVLEADELEAAMIVVRRALGGLSYPEVYEREAILRDGGRRLLELRSNVLQRRGRPYALQTIGRDVTDQRDGAAFQSSLLQASEALLRAPSMNEACREICDHARRILGVDGAYIWLRESDALVGCAAAGRGAEDFVGVRRPIATSLIGRLYSADDVRIINDFAGSEFDVARSEAFGVKAMMAMPLRRTDPPLGVMVLTDCSNAKRFTRTLRDRAVILGVQTTVAVEAAMSRDREREEGEVSASLLRVARTIRESLEEAEVLPRIARGAREVLQSDFSAVTLFDTDRSSFVVAATEGLAPDLVDKLRILDFRPGTLEAVDELVAGKTYAFHQPTGEALYEQFGVRALLVVPLVSKGKTIGSLAIGYTKGRGAFSARERRIAEGTASQAAVAVENARLLEALRRASDLKSEFLGTVSHELRTPLSAILGYAELLRDGAMGAVNGDQIHALERMLQNGSALLELINMTLDVNRLEAGRITLDLSAFSLGEMLKELRNEFSVRAADSPATTLVWPEPEHVADVDLRGDRAKLKAVLRNLVDNALKFTPRGFVRVDVSRAMGPGRVTIEVSDSGMGIAAEAQKFIFEMFRQVEGARSRSRSGVGLGLYLVKRYVELMGGRVSVESQVGQGSMFRIELPTEIAMGGEG